jgi:hypothetical protein
MLLQLGHYGGDQHEAHDSHGSKSWPARLRCHGIPTMVMAHFSMQARDGLVSMRLWL